MPVITKDTTGAVVPAPDPGEIPAPVRDTHQPFAAILLCLRAT